MWIIYDLIFFIFAVIYFPYMLLEGKWHSGFLSRFGSFPESLRGYLISGQNIWVHAVSVGEVNAVSGLVERLAKKYPGYRIIISVVTKTGYQLACARFKEHKVIFAPLDFSFAVKKYLNLIKPKLYISTETEIWPNLYTFLSKRGVPIILVNGRISDISFERYLKIKFLVKKVLGCVTYFCMQSQQDANRIIELGAPKKKVEVCGNMKFDDLPEENDATLWSLGLEKDELLFIAGSTHPGEEEVVLDVFSSLSKEFEKLRLIIVPRHIERTGSILELVRERGYAPVKFSHLNSVRVKSDMVIVVDTIGQLRSLYSLASVVFVGKSLAGHGGQNIIEPAFFGKPVIVGPHMENFKDITEIFLKAKALIQVKNEGGLLSAVRRVLLNTDDSGGLGERAKKVVQKYRGATKRCLDVIGHELT